MQTKKNRKLQNEDRETSNYFEKIKEYEEAKKDLARGIDITTIMDDKQYFKSVVHRLNRRTIVHNKLTEVISIGFKLLDPEEACRLLGINKSQYEKIDFNQKLPIIRLGKTFDEDFSDYEKKRETCLILHAIFKAKPEIIS